jgi:hypothetical protein
MFSKEKKYKQILMKGNVMKTILLGFLVIVVCLLSTNSLAADTSKAEMPTILNGIKVCVLSEADLGQVRGEVLFLGPPTAGQILGQYFKPSITTMIRIIQLSGTKTYTYTCY